jgi:hypothetical protein
LDLNKELPLLKSVEPEMKNQAANLYIIGAPFEPEYMSFMNRKGERFNGSLQSK